MFARVVALLPLALLVSASHLKARDQCNTGSVTCCENTQTVSQSQNTLEPYGLAGVLTDASGLIGTDCSSVTGGGTGSGCDAQQQPLCCTGNTYDGLVNFGCSPINTNI